jgi:hypothetical protein
MTDVKRYLLQGHGCRESKVVEWWLSPGLISYPWGWQKTVASDEVWRLLWASVFSPAAISQSYHP